MRAHLGVLVAISLSSCTGGVTERHVYRDRSSLTVVPLPDTDGARSINVVQGGRTVLQFHWRHDPVLLFHERTDDERVEELLVSVPNEALDRTPPFTLERMEMFYTEWGAVSRPFAAWSVHGTISVTEVERDHIRVTLDIQVRSAMGGSRSLQGHHTLLKPKD